VDWLSSFSDFSQVTLPFLERLPVIRAVLGITLVFFLPGFAWTLVFFKKPGILARGVLSIGLSIALVALSILFANYVLGVRISGANSILILIVITLVPLAIYFLRRWVRQRRRRAEQDVAGDRVRGKDSGN